MQVLKNSHYVPAPPAKVWEEKRKKKKKKAYQDQSGVCKSPYKSNTDWKPVVAQSPRYTII